MNHGKKSRDKFTLGKWQRFAAVKMIKQGGVGLFAQPGLRKTSTSLYAFRILKRLNPNWKALVIAPLPAALNTWPDEIEKWIPFGKLKYKVLHGKDKKDLIKDDADIYILNAEYTPWFFEEVISNFDKFPFQVCIVDESTLYKSGKAKRFKLLNTFRPLFKHFWALTGTPFNRHLEDLFYQMLLIDQGKTLGRFVTHFRSEYMDSHPKNRFVRWPKKDAMKSIQKKIKPSIVAIERKDWVGMPEIIHVPVYVRLSKKEMEVYREMEKELVSKIRRDMISTANALTLYGALRQLANGAMYEDRRKWIADCEQEGKRKRVAFNLHNEKVQHLKTILDEIGDSPVLCAYQFRFQIDQLVKGLPFKFNHLGSGTKPKDIHTEKEKWLKNKTRFLAVHPKTVSHSLNLQYSKGRNILWLAPDDSAERTIQLNERIYRPGVSSDVTVHYLIAKDTIEETIFERIMDSKQQQESMIRFLKRFARKK